MNPPPHDRFSALVAAPQFDLLEAALWLAADAYPQLDVPAYVQRVQSMADTVRMRLAADAFAEQRIMALNHHLFVELGLRGAIDDYYDPRNSYLNEVIDRRRGIPISLSVLYMEVGRRVGLALEGVSFPGHFLVKIRVRRGQLVLDPFAGGVPVSEDELRQRLKRVFGQAGPPVQSIDPYLERASGRDILKRMLRNLKAVHAQKGRFEEALAVLNRLVPLAPESPDERRDRGLVYRRLDCFRPALADLQDYLCRRPDAHDAGEVRAIVVDLERMVARLN